MNIPILVCVLCVKACFIDVICAKLHAWLPNRLIPCKVGGLMLWNPGPADGPHCEREFLTVR